MADREDAFSREAINFDEKNYHAWAHRQSIVKVRMERRSCPYIIDDILATSVSLFIGYALVRVTTYCSTGSCIFLLAFHSLLGSTVRL